MTKLNADEALYALLCKYVLGEADGAERQWVGDWLRTDPAHSELLASLEKLLAAPAHATVTLADTEQAWQSLHAKMGGLTVARKRSWWMAAAVLLLAAGTGLWWLSARNNRVQRYTGPVLAQLKDGTTVQLEGKSRLQVLPGFGRHQREVTLEGKAIFDVTPDAALPFIVNVGGRTIKVLGTRFMVDLAAGKGGTLRIHVNTGSVMVTDAQSLDSVVLSAGMLMELQDGQVPFRIATHVTDPAGKQLVFADTPLSEVLQTIAVIYDIHVTADTTLLRMPVTATFTGESVDNILASLAFMTNADVVRSEARIILKKHNE
jgi:ferric-dicitrate binding protein FerR (iron transport regulator)